MSDDLVAVAVLRVPVPLWAQSREHVDELLREFTLMAAQLRERQDHHQVPVRLTELIETLTAEYGGLSAVQEARLAQAAAAGEPEIDLTYYVPPRAIDAVIALGDLLDEADAYCREGDHLLTLATPADLVRFRHWFLDDFRHQLACDAPTLFSEYPT